MKNILMRIIHIRRHAGSSFSHSLVIRHRLLVCPAKL